MPKATQPDASEWLTEQVSANALASVLGVAQNTVLEWREEGAPLILMPCLWIAWAIRTRPSKAAERGWMRFATKYGVEVVDTADPAPQANGHAFPDIAKIGDYDRLLAKPRSWADAKTREQVQAEILGNRKLREEAAVRRRGLIPKKEADQASVLVVRAFERAGQSMPDRTIKAMGKDTTNEVRSVVARSVAQAWDDALAEVKIDLDAPP